MIFCTSSAQQMEIVLRPKPLSSVGIQCSAALSALDHASPSDLAKRLTSEYNCLSLNRDYLPEALWVGACTQPLAADLSPIGAHLHSRNLRLAITAMQQMAGPIAQLTAGLPKRRLAIIVGTSTSGIADNQLLLEQQLAAQQGIHLEHRKQAMSALAQGLQQYLGWKGVAYSISTACSSSAKALAAGQRLLCSDMADLVLVGGVDSLCKLTLQGFNSLQSLSGRICQPFGAVRDGINIGEAAALFVLSRDAAPVLLCGSGESMDAWHISAPHPEGRGAAQAMQRALAAAQLDAAQIDYLNLHGTATIQNDAMEGKAVATVFQHHPVWVSSTKHKTGHCLGAAGALEAYIGQQILASAQPWLPWHHLGAIDASFENLNFVWPTATIALPNYVMSNSFAFGGSNISLILARGTACSAMY
jgi:3-oxoacyl-[acyl-carrier-protein] synthase-1